MFENFFIEAKPIIIDLIAGSIVTCICDYVLKKNYSDYKKSIIKNFLIIGIIFLSSVIGTHYIQSSISESNDITNNEHYIAALNNKEKNDLESCIEDIVLIPNKFTNDELYIKLKTEISELYKNKILDVVQSYINKKEYKSADEYLNKKSLKLNKIMQNDKDIENKSNEIFGYISEQTVNSFLSNGKYDEAKNFCNNERAKEYCNACNNIQDKIDAALEKAYENLKNKQEVSVIDIDTNESESWSLKYLHCEPTVINTTNKPVKNIKIIVLHYDKDGFPHNKIDEANAEHMRELEIENINILPKNKKRISYTEVINNNCIHYAFDEEMMKYSKGCKLIACVKDAEYYDGSKWSNKFYDQWFEKHYNKMYVSD